MRRRHPNVVVHGPVRHGDLFTRKFADDDVVVIVDGLYHHRLALRHKEILDALARGVTVLGAASIGALRAAEVDRFGMIGVGRVYSWYRDGVFDGDDAVSVAHGETGSLAGINVPLVNLHTAVLAAYEAGVLTHRAGRDLMERTQREYYPLRTQERILAVARECGEAAFADWYAARLAADPVVFDQKRADALEALALAERLDSRPHLHSGTTGPGRAVEAAEALDAAEAREALEAADVPEAPDAPSTPNAPASSALPTTGDRDWRTEYHRRWRNQFAPDDPSLRHRVAYQQIFTADFPDLWWDFLQRRATEAADSPGGLRDHVLRHLGPAAARWHDDPALRHRVTALLCPLPDLADPRESEPLLRGETPSDRARVTDWLERNRRYLDTHPERSLAQISDATCAGLLRRIWNVGTDAELITECARRGLPSPRHAAVALRPFAIGYLGSRASREPAGGEARA
ncbi:TfuA-like protein [Streptomyces sp. NPDC007808]|uniref:TfuA-like protein n=1 Tax=Streptomyces sp. NPDC007808 TaxID=3364779 RepID=UPI0036CF4A0F